MKKLVALAMIAGAVGITTVSAEAKTNTTAAAEPVAQRMQRQTIRVRPNGRVVRTVTRTRRVRVGRQLYRETYQIRYLPNGRTNIRVISRVRVR